MKELNEGDKFEQRYGPKPSGKNVDNKIADLERRLPVEARCLALQRMLDECTLQMDKGQQLLEYFDKHPLEEARPSTQIMHVKVGRSFHSFLPREASMETNPSGETRKRTEEDIARRRIEARKIKEAMQRARPELGLEASSRLKSSAAESWLRMICPKFSERVTELESAGLMKKTEDGFDWQCSQASLLLSLIRLAFSSWTDLCRYFTISGKRIKPVNIRSHASQLDPSRGASANPPRDWSRITAVMGE